MSEIIRRESSNPIINPSDVPGGSLGIYNSAVVKYEDGYKGVFRVDGFDVVPRLHVGTSKDGLKFEINQQPIYFSNQRQGHELSCGGCGGWDPRVTKLEETYYITFANGSVIGIGKTEDFGNFEYICTASAPKNRNCVLFPEKIDGMYARFERPEQLAGSQGACIWYSTSPDLVHWGNFRLVLSPFGHWAGYKVGAGAPPIKTEKGWLEIYHAVRKTCNGLSYSMGAMMLDLEKPWKCIGCAKETLLYPQMDYERVGTVQNVIFPTATIMDDNTRELSIYYGAADTSTCVAYANLDDLVSFCLKE